MRQRRLLLFLLALLTLLAVPASAPAYTTGIGDQRAAMFSSPFFQQLHVGIARVIVPYDVMDDPVSLAETTQWLAAAKAQNVTPLVAFYHSRLTPTTIPGVPTYTADVQRFMKAFPAVTEYQPWNEANRGNVNSGATRFASPTAAQAAGFYEALLGACPTCTIAGLDILDSQHLSATVRYTKAFMKAVTHMPSVWGLHNYTDTNRFQNKSTRAIAKLVPGKLWLTETGGIVKFGRSFPNKRHSGEKRASKALSYMFKLAKNPKIARLYIFQWTGASPRARFDAGLMDRTGTKPRKGYFTVRKHLRGR